MKSRRYQALERIVYFEVIYRKLHSDSDCGIKRKIKLHLLFVT